MPLRKIVHLIVFATILAAIYPLSIALARGPVELITPGVDKPGRPVLASDFPDYVFEPVGGHDGEQYYLIARSPMHLAETGPSLDRPRYRLGRILFPTMAWALHPQGGGTGLIAALVIVGLIGVAVCTAAMARLSTLLGGSPRVALLVAGLPGTYWALRISTADVLATGLTLFAVCYSLEQRNRRAVVFGIAAAFARESVLLVFVGLALWRRDKAGAMLAAVPTVVFSCWVAVLRLVVADDGVPAEGFTLPGMGYFEAWRLAWSHGKEIDGAVLAFAIWAVALLALRRQRLAGPFGWIILLHLALFVFMDETVVGFGSNVSRTTLPFVTCAILALAVPRPADRETELHSFSDDESPSDAEALLT